MARKSQLQDGHRRSAVTDNQRWSRTRWQLPQLRLRNSGDLRDRFVNVRVRLEKHFHHGDAVEGLRFDVLNIIDQRR